MAFDDEDDNGSDLTDGGRDRLAAILIHVGATRKGIRRLEQDFATVKDALAKTVTTEQCHDRHEAVTREVMEIKGDIRAIKKGTTGTAHAAINPAMVAAMARGDTGQMQIPPTEPPEKVIDKLLEERKGRARRELNFWLGLIISVATILGGIIFGLIKVGRYLDRVDRAVETSGQHTEQLQDELRRELAKRQAPVIIRVPVAPDAGATPPVAPPPRKGLRPRSR